MVAASAGPAAPAASAAAPSRAARWLAIAALLQLALGVLSAYQGVGEYSALRQRLAPLEADVAVRYDGRLVAAGELRDQLRLRQRQAGAVPLSLAALLLGFAVWARRTANVRAVAVAAAACYLLVLGLDGLLDPRQWARALAYELIVLFALWRALHACWRGHGRT
ncbi:MAG: hypothetical protein AB8H80_17480 [Planctomycetota bacterium]